MADGKLQLGIFLDLRSTQPSRHTGVGKHCREVVDGLIRSDEFRVQVWVARDQMDLWAELQGRNGWEDVETLRLDWGIRGLRFWSLLGLCPRRVGRAGDLDMMYSPQEFCLNFRHLPFICTLHGFPCFAEQLPRNLKNSWRYRWERVKQRLLIKQVTRQDAPVLVVSQALAKETCRRFGIAPERIRVVGNGVEDVFLNEALPSRPAGNAGLIQVGGLNAFDGAEALSGLVSHPEFSGTLRIVGDRHEDPWHLQLRGNDRVTFSGFLQGGDLRKAMRSSRALLLLPLAESFGITGLEALALGVPVIAVRVGGLEEVLGDCALWVESVSPESIIAALGRLDEMSDADYRAWQKRGRERALRFRWADVVEKVAELLCAASGGSEK
jgi:glycosyltransferase involved in cell wall biosynthesis